MIFSVLLDLDDTVVSLYTVSGYIKICSHNMTTNVIPCFPFSVTTGIFMSLVPGLCAPHLNG